MLLIRNLGAALVLAALILGCVTTYKYDGQTYGDMNAAIQAAKNDLSSQLIYIEKSPSALDRRVAFVIPDRQRTRERGVVGADSASLEAAKYVTEVLYISYQDMGESLRVSEAFRSVSIMDSTDPASFSVESGDYDFIVYLDLVDQETAQWYIKGTVSGGPLSLPVDLGVERRFRKRDWVKLVRAKAEELDSTEASQRGTSIQSVQ